MMMDSRMKYTKISMTLLAFSWFFPMLPVSFAEGASAEQVKIFGKTVACGLARIGPLCELVSANPRDVVVVIVSAYSLRWCNSSKPSEARQLLELGESDPNIGRVPHPEKCRILLDAIDESRKASSSTKADEKSSKRIDSGSPIESASESHPDTGYRDSTLGGNDPSDRGSRTRTGYSARVVGDGAVRAKTDPLDDFDVTIPSSCPRVVRICVRDHKCEDGDRVSVFVNDKRVFSGEIMSGERCVNAPVRAGINSVRLLALNGTGGKGDCPNNVNTGEIKISSGNVQMQQWQHNGGKGSSADLVVTVGPPAAKCH